MPSLFTVRWTKIIKKCMLFTAEVIPEMLEDRRKRRVDAEYGLLKARHFLSVCTTKCEQRKTTIRYVVCYKNKVRKQSRYHCENCQDRSGLCPAPCFMIYHTQIDHKLNPSYLKFLSEKNNLKRKHSKKPKL